MREIGPRPAGEHPHPLHWAEVRAAALQRDQGCRSCGDDRQLEVHHRTYERWGRELVADLTTFCRPCHDAITGLMMRLRDARRALPAERITVTVERFEPSEQPALPIVMRDLLAPERMPVEVAADLPPARRVSVLVERVVELAVSELPLPRRNPR